MRNYWDKKYQEKGRILKNPQDDIPRISKIFKEGGIKRILDLGCGSGRNLVYLAKQGFNVYGIDIAKSGIKITKDWLKNENLKGNLKIGDMYQRLPYSNNFFDAIISIQTLHHGKINKIRKLIKEMERILKPNGLVFITVRRALRVHGWERGKVIVHKWKGWKRKKVKYKIIDWRTYVPIEKAEKDDIHFNFTKPLIQKEFKNFKIPKIWIRRGYYCFLGKRK